MMIQSAHSLLDPCGFVASLHTPFTTDDVVDEDSLGRLVEHAGKAGCAGVLATAVAGEVGALRPDERRRVLRVVAEAEARLLAERATALDEEMLAESRAG